MARWILLFLALAGLALAFTTKSPSLLGVGILLILVGSFGFVVSLANARISANARPETAMASAEDLMALRRQRAMPPRPAQPPLPQRSDPPQ